MYPHYNRLVVGGNVSYLPKLEGWFCQIPFRNLVSLITSTHIGCLHRQELSTIFCVFICAIVCY